MLSKNVPWIFFFFYWFEIEMEYFILTLFHSFKMFCLLINFSIRLIHVILLSIDHNLLHTYYCMLALSNWNVLIRSVWCFWRNVSEFPPHTIVQDFEFSSRFGSKGCSLWNWFFPTSSKMLANADFSFSVTAGEILRWPVKSLHSATSTPEF